jgi:hypothetical protein
MTDHTTYLGRDTEVEYLLTRWDDDTFELATRPIGGSRWSPPSALTEQSAAIIAAARDLPVTTLAPAGANGGGGR